MPMTQRELMLAKFRGNRNVLTTADFGADHVLWSEYRRLLCELRANGFLIIKTQIKKNLFRYELRESVDGQFEMAL